MVARQRIVLERRRYNQWAADQTLEDYALRFTASRARRSPFRVGNTALGAISFLACEAIGGSVTLTFGFANAVAAIIAVSVLMFLVGLPIAYHAAKAGVDIDLLTRGAGFGYLGSTVTSLIYASFTFLLFSIEASIMSVALETCLGIPLPIAHVISSTAVIPIAAYGFRWISRMQLATQPVWLVLQFAPLAFIAYQGRSDLVQWAGFPGIGPDGGTSLDILRFGMAASVLLSLLPQIGEQVDYLRFLPARARRNRAGWWFALIATGPGWVVVGGFKLLAGSFLTYLALSRGVPAESAAQPTELYHLAFLQLFGSPGLALALTGIFVVTCQIKINVTNAYAGSIAWSNFFSRLTHSHPGRVVWLVFNVLLALLLMETGIFRAIEGVLGFYANFAVAWMGALTGDLMINKPLGLSPPAIEFKRAHLYDVNPVGTGAMLISVVISTVLYLGFCGPIAQSLSPFIGLVVAFTAAPVIAWATGGRYYLARPATGLPDGQGELVCSICENSFERRDMAFCPAYGGTICSLCCTLDARCHDLCKPESRVADQGAQLMRRVLPARVAALLATRLGQFVCVLGLFAAVIAALLAFIYFKHAAPLSADDRETIRTTLWLVFLSLIIVAGVAAWLLVLAHESRRVAEKESERQTAILMSEIEAHERTDAALQKAKEVAEAANIAKSRYIVGLSHEIRTPLNAIFGYAQLMERDPAVKAQDSVRVIRRSAEHLSNLVDGLLDISRIESGTLRLHRDKVRLVEFLDQIVDMFRLQATAKGIAFRYERPDHLPAYIHTDEKRLRQVLINLLSNAIKYTEAGHAALTVRYRNQVAEFEIADSGIGIRPEDLELVFEPFERGTMPSARALPGTGLGLTITKLLTEVMGGRVAVESRPGMGSRFTVRLMLSEAMHSAADLGVRRRTTGYAGPRLKVLLADDDTSHLDFVRRVLEPLGFVLFTAPNGLTALDLAHDVDPDLVMLDISMPGHTGWEVANLLRARERPGLRIMMVSANAHDYREPDPEAGPHDAFLVKPLDVQQMLDRIQALTGLEWIEEAAPEAVVPQRFDPADLPAGSNRHLAELNELGRIGYVRGIEAKLKEMVAEDTAYTPLAAALRALVRNFELKKYMDTLKELTP